MTEEEVMKLYDVDAQKVLKSILVDGKIAASTITVAVMVLDILFEKHPEIYSESIEMFEKHYQLRAKKQGN
jgi:hypothetical protein